MAPGNILNRVKHRLRREAADRLQRRPVRMRNRSPLVSFTFDDFPRSALWRGGTILRSFGYFGTFFTSFGLMGRIEPTGQIFSSADLSEFLAQKHELGCHTFDHRDAWESNDGDFAASVMRNRTAAQEHLGIGEIRTCSYPISWPHPRIKRKVGSLFACCRGGGQTFNSGSADLNHLKAFFIEKSRDDLSSIESLLEANARRDGWLIFATHDVSDSPTRFGCTPGFFESVVKAAQKSGAKVLPVLQACREIVSIPESL